MSTSIDIDEALQRVQAQKAHLERLEEAYRLVAEDQAKVHAQTKGASIRRLEPVAATEQPQAPIAQPKSELVREAISRVQGEFDVSDLYANGLPPSVNRQDVSFILSRFKRSGFLEMVAAGSGKKPSIFRVKRESTTTHPSP